MAGEVQGISTYQTYLMYKTSSSGTYAKLIDITSFPDLIPAPQRIDITTLSDKMRKYIQGIGDTSEMTFGANYTPANFKAVNDLNGNQYWYAVYFGASGDTPDGHNGIFEWQGDVSASVNGGGVNAAVGMTVTAVPSTVITPTITT